MGTLNDTLEIINAMGDYEVYYYKKSLITKKNILVQEFTENNKEGEHAPTIVNESLYIFTNKGEVQQTETETDTCAYIVDEIACRNVHCTGKLYKALKNDF